jgi:hypothetical protein
MVLGEDHLQGYVFILSSLACAEAYAVFPRSGKVAKIYTQGRSSVEGKILQESTSPETLVIPYEHLTQFRLS